MSDSPVNPLTVKDSQDERSVAGVGACRAPATARPPPTTADWRKRLEIALLSGPAILMFVAFVIFPVCLAAYYGFFQWKGYGKPTDFVGLKNYQVILTDPEFHAALSHNVFIVVVSLLIQGPIAIGLALLLNRKMRGRSLIRVLIFVPYVISEVIVGTGWSLMLQTNGAVNGLLNKLGLGSLASDWLSNPNIAIWTLMVIISWKYIGFAVILFMAGAAEHPGGAVRGGRDRRRHLLADPATHHPAAARPDPPDLGVPVDHRVAAAVRPRLHHLGPVRRAARPASRRWRPTWSSTAARPGNYGYGSAVAVVLFLISLIIALIYQRFVLRRDTEGALTERRT